MTSTPLTFLNSTWVKEYLSCAHLVLCPWLAYLCERNSCYVQRCSWWRSRLEWCRPTCPPRCRCPLLPLLHLHLDPTRSLRLDSRSRWQLCTGTHPQTDTQTHFNIWKCKKPTIYRKATRSWRPSHVQTSKKAALPLSPGTLEMQSTWALQTLNWSTSEPGWLASMMTTLLAEWVLVRIHTRLLIVSVSWSSFDWGSKGKRRQRWQRAQMSLNDHFSLIIVENITRKSHRREAWCCTYTGMLNVMWIMWTCCC